MPIYTSSKKYNFSQLILCRITLNIWGAESELEFQDKMLDLQK